MNEKEALTRIKIGNFNNGYGFDIQLLVDTVGIIGELFKNGQISEIVRCKNCQHNCGKGRETYYQFIECEKTGAFHKEDWFCADGKK